MRSIYRVLAVTTAAAAALTAGTLGSHSAQAAGTTRYVATSGTDNPTCYEAHPCQHVQHAVDVANPGDTIRVKAGTYVEQVTITKSVNIVGDGVDATTIKAPPVMVPEPTYHETYIVEIKGAAATVGMTKLTVRGPGVGAGCSGDGVTADPTAIDNGVMVVEMATLGTCPPRPCATSSPGQPAGLPDRRRDQHRQAWRGRSILGRTRPRHHRGCAGDQLPEGRNSGPQRGYHAQSLRDQDR